jgi:hypothetical protein
MAPPEAYVRRRMPPSAVADIVSETFLAAWRKLDQVDDQPLPWLYRAAALQLSPEACWHMDRSMVLKRRICVLAIPIG